MSCSGQPMAGEGELGEISLADQILVINSLPGNSSPHAVLEGLVLDCSCSHYPKGEHGHARCIVVTLLVVEFVYGVVLVRYDRQREENDQGKSDPCYPRETEDKQYLW